MRPHSERRRQSGLRLFATAVLTSAVPVVLIGLVAVHQLGRGIDDLGLDNAVAQARVMANAGIEPILDGRDLRAGMTEADRADVTQTAQRLERSKAVLRIRVRATDGAIVFDGDDPTVRFVPDRDDEVDEAAHGEEVRTLTRINADQVDSTHPLGPRAVEVYLPLHSTVAPGHIIGVLEVYVPYDGIAATLDGTRRDLTVVLAVGLTLLWLILGLISWTATRRLRLSALEIRRLGRTDQLTGMPNRMAFDAEVRHLVDRNGGVANRSPWWCWTSTTSSR